jgi:hypothetical protein
MLLSLTLELRCCVPPEEGNGKYQQVTRLLRWLAEVANRKANRHDNCDSERARQLAAHRRSHWPAARTDMQM